MDKIFILIKFLITFLLGFPAGIYAQCTASGNITHTFNANAAGKPDAGSKIYLLKYEGDVVPLYEAINNFLTAKHLRNLNNDVARQIGLYKDSAAALKGQRKFEAKYAEYLNTVASIKAEEAARMATLQALGAESNNKFDMLDMAASKAISQVKLKAHAQMMLADDQGNFSKVVEPGKHMILFISNNRTGFTTSEGSGKIYTQLLEMKDWETTNVVKKFIPD